MIRGHRQHSKHHLNLSADEISQRGRQSAIRYVNDVDAGKRWIVERTFAWISRNRRLARDFERYATTVAAFVRLAMIRIMLRQLAAANSSS